MDENKIEKNNTFYIHYNKLYNNLHYRKVLFSREFNMVDI